MTAPRRYRGIMTATPTPLDTKGAVIAASVRDHVERQIQAGITGILPIGGTGEFNSLTASQRLRMVELTVEAANGRVPVVAGVLHPGLADAIEAAQNYLKAGADSIMVVTPYYYRPTQEGIVEYFRRLQDRVDGDLVLYEIPYRTGVSLLPETVARIVEHTRTVAMKACNQDLAQRLRVVQAVGDRIAILTGEESVFPLHVAMGDVGGMLAGSNLFPATWTRIFEMAAAGDATGATALHAQLQPATDALYCEPNPAPLKAAMALLDMPMGTVIAPMLEASAACIERLKLVLPAAMALERASADAASPSRSSRAPH
jgi:4-hydroxy-tetrahydrodipicolinate synthase